MNGRAFSKSPRKRGKSHHHHHHHHHHLSVSIYTCLWLVTNCEWNHFLWLAPIRMKTLASRRFFHTRCKTPFSARRQNGYLWQVSSKDYVQSVIKNWFCRMPAQTSCRRVCLKWRVYIPLGAFFFEDVPLVEFMYPVFTRTPGGVTVGDSGFCCCAPCLSSAVISLCKLYTGALGLTLFQMTIVHSEADMSMCRCVFIYMLSQFGILGPCPVFNTTWFCRMPVHVSVAECAWNEGYIGHWGHPF